jgi:hypothetical protein
LLEAPRASLPRHFQSTKIKDVQASLFKSANLMGMHAIVTCTLIVGLAALLVIGLLRVIRDLFSGSVLAAPAVANDAGTRKENEMQ